MFREFKGIKVTSLKPIPEEKLRELHDFSIAKAGVGMSWCFGPHEIDPNKPTWLLLQFDEVESYAEKKDLPGNEPGKGIEYLEDLFKEFGAKAEFFRGMINTSPVYVSRTRFMERRQGATVDSNLDADQIVKVSDSLSAQFGLTVQSFAVSSDAERPGTLIFTERHDHNKPLDKRLDVESMLQDQFGISAKYNGVWMDRQTQKPVVGNWNALAI